MKKDNSLLPPENDRPINLLSTISKILVKVICRQMYKIFSKKRSTFHSINLTSEIKQRSCVHAICEVTDYNWNKIDNRSNGNACFIDFKKAFGTLYHSIHL